MPRLARKDYNTSFFHVMCQGINREDIFKNDMLKKKYLFFMKKYLDDIDIISYCIMSNHVHIVLYTDDISKLSMYMKKVNTEFAKFYNWYTKRVGFVFRDRFKSQPIYEKKHLFQCINYVHLNPVRAGIVTKCSDYKYSSYNDFVNKRFLRKSKYIDELFSNNTFFYVDKSSDFIDIDYNKDVVIDEYVEIFCRKNDVSLDKVLEDKELRGELLKIILKSGLITKNDIQEKLGISFWKISNSLNNSH